MSSVRPVKVSVSATAASLGLASLLAGHGGCGTPSAEPAQPAVQRVGTAASSKAKPPAAPAAAARATAHTAARAGAEIAIPPGKLSVGSRPGTAHRNTALEADALEREMPGFAIDALPYPNDPAQPARVLVQRDEASALCAEQGKRLCTELEWERACKGDEQHEYPAANYDATLCARDPTACASSLGVFALGTQGREWTSSDAPASGGGARKAVVRGAPKEAARELHRCAAREALAPESKSEGLTFRCCRGPVAEGAYPEEPQHAPFEERALTLEEARALLAAMPETAALAPTFRAFRSEEISRRLTAQDHRGASLAPWIWTAKELLWSPRPGERIGVLAGDTPQGALLVVFHRSSAGGVHFATSYVAQNEHDPIIVAYKPDAAAQVLFSTCWGCGGEGGALEIGSDARVRIALR